MSVIFIYVSKNKIIVLMNYERDKEQMWNAMEHPLFKEINRK